MMASGARRKVLTAVAILALSLTSAAPVARSPLSVAHAAQVISVDNAALIAGLQTLNSYAALAQTALGQNDLTAARAAYAQFDQGWDAIEDGVRERSRDDYRNIEDAMSDVDRALRGSNPDPAQINALLAELQARVDRFIATLPSS
jgi:predicted lipoprotein